LPKEKDLEIINKQISDLVPYVNNPKQHPEKQIDKIASSIKEFGFKVPMLITEDNEIIAGHGRYEASKKLGLSSVPCIVASDLSEAEVKAFRLADNRVSESSWDEELLGTELETLDEDFSFDLELTGFDETEISNYLDINKEVEEDSLSDVYDPENFSIDSRVQKGEVWELGRHRLMCGDATKEKDIDKLMDGEEADMVFTDPPYGIEDIGWVESLLTYSCDNSHVFVLGNEKLVTRISYNYLDLFSRLYAVDLRQGKLINTNSPMTRVDYVTELNKGENKFNNLNDGFTTLIECSKSRKSDVENNLIKHHKKPKLPSEFVKHFSERKDIVLDLFGGSGSTLISCEKLGRRCFLLEKNLKHCELILRRYEENTGNEVTKLSS